MQNWVGRESGMRGCRRWPHSSPRWEQLRGRQEGGKQKNRNQGERGRRYPIQRLRLGEEEIRQRNGLAK